MIDTGYYELLNFTVYLWNITDNNR